MRQFTLGEQREAITVLGPLQDCRNLFAAQFGSQVMWYVHAHVAYELWDSVLFLTVLIGVPDQRLEVGAFVREYQKQGGFYG